MRVSCHVTYRIASHRIAGHRMSVRDILCPSKYEDVCKLIGVLGRRAGSLRLFARLLISILMMMMMDHIRLVRFRFLGWMLFGGLWRRGGRGRQDKGSWASNTAELIGLVRAGCFWRAAAFGTSTTFNPPLLCSMCAKLGRGADVGLEASSCLFPSLTPPLRASPPLH